MFATRENGECLFFSFQIKLTRAVRCLYFGFLNDSLWLMYQVTSVVYLAPAMQFFQWLFEVLFFLKVNYVLCQEVLINDWAVRSWAAGPWPSTIPT